MASALLLTHEYQKHSVLSFDISMKKAKSNKTCSRKHVSACVGTSETVAESDGIPYGHMYPFAEKNSLTEYPRSVSDSDEAGSKRKSISLNANVREESHGVGASLSKDEKRELRKKLRLDLEQVRSLSLKLEAKEHQIRSLSYSGFHASYSDAHLSRTENRCSMEKEVTSEPPIAQLGSMHFGHNDRKRLERQASFLSSDRIETPGAGGKEKRIETPGAGGKEKRTPKANQLYLNSEFLSGKERMPPPEKLKPKAASGTKRSQGKDEDLNLKWQRVQSARSRRMIDIMKQCGTVLRKLMVHRHGWVFNEPVDAVKLQLSDYHKVIKRPMDLGTVKRNLEIGQYQSPMEFAEDVRLTFANAMKYNPKENDVHMMADILRRIFEERWKGIREKLEEESLKVRVEDEVLCEKQEKSQQLQDLKRHLRSIEDQIISFEKNTNGKPMAPSRATVPSNKSKEVPKRAMTFDEKSQLSVNLERLPGEKTQEIIQIIKKRNPSLSQSQIGDAGFEIEVDIDAVDNDTLWELQRFVTNCMKNVKKTKRKTTEAKAVHHMGSNGENVIGFGGNTSVVKNRKNDLEEDVDIDDDMPSAQFPPVVVEKDTVGDASKSSSSSSSSSDSGSSSSDSDSGSSSGSETEAGDS